MSASTLLPPGLDDSTVFRSLFSAYPDGLLLVDSGGRIAMANPMAASLLGYAVDELVGSSVDALVPDGIRQRHAAYRQAYAAAPRTRPMGTQMALVARRRDGSEAMVEIALSPLQDHGLPFVVAAIRDIAEYPRVKQALQRARYSEHVAQLGRLAVDARDPQQLIQRVPVLAAEALEVDTALVLLLESNGLELRVAGGVGLLAAEAPGATLAPRSDTPLGLVMAQGRPVVVEDGRADLRFAASPEILEAGLTSSMTVPLLDRSRVIGALKVRSRQPRRFGDEEQRFLESLASLLGTSLQRAQTEEALNHAQRLESVGQLTGGIAHDFNNLLTVIQGNLQVLEELPALAQDAVGQQLVGAAMRASRRGAELTGKLLAFSRRQVLQPSAVEVPALLNPLAELLRRTLDQRIRIDVEVEPGCPPVLADPGQLEAALLNIAINARDAMLDGGRLGFRAAVADLPALGARLREELGDGEFICISVADTGTGMPESVKERAFEPFFTTKQVGRGTGLGLSAVYGFVKQSRGAVSLDSVTGQGTTISLYLPVPGGAQAAAADEEAEGDGVPAGLRVLLVEDDAEVREVAQHFLTHLGCSFRICASAEQALTLLTPEADFELLISDIALGAGMRGTELARVAQQRLPGLAVLLMSGFSAELLDADRESPADWELLPKPYSRSQLAQAIASTLARAA
ncbi:PAS domain S-box protein [Roseateles sp. LKC17W]|uniref:histidine kinase n=1 Tax=Pelomonas margarita TaxID=3299031 RepID=A0ABW7FIM1_9BURK